MIHSKLHLVAAMGLTAAIAGCGGDLADVQGRVTLGDKPVTNTVVRFIPESGPQAQGRLNENGTYRLTTPGKGNGTLPGEYRVYFVPDISDEEEAAKESLSEADFAVGKTPKVSRTPPPTILPPKFLSAHTSGLVRNVESGSNELNFDLSE